MAASELITDVTVAYSVNLVLLKVSKAFRRYRIDHGHTVVWFFPVSTLKLSECHKKSFLGLENFKFPFSMVSLTHALHASYSIKSRYTKLTVPYVAILQRLQLPRLDLYWRPAANVLKGGWCCNWFTISLCCDTFKDNDIFFSESAYSFVGCLSDEEVIIELLEEVRQNQSKMKNVYDASKTLLRQCKKLFFNYVKTDAYIKGVESRSLICKRIFYKRYFLQPKEFLVSMNCSADQNVVSRTELYHMLLLLISKHANRLKFFIYLFIWETENWSKINQSVTGTNQLHFYFLNSKRYFLSKCENNFIVLDLAANFRSA